jgi:hypothetical protein
LILLEREMRETHVEARRTESPEYQLRKEEQRRFEILNSPWDVVADDVDLDAK